MKSQFLSPAHVARSLVTFMLLTFIQVVGAPVLIPDYSIPSAQAGAVSTNGLILDWEINNSSSYPGSGTTITDLRGNSNGTAFGSPTYSSSGGAYFNLVGTTNTSGQYIVSSTSLKNQFNTQTYQRTISYFTWIYPTGNGIIVSELGSTAIDAGWHDSQIEMVSGVLNFRVWNGTTISSSIATPFNNWYYVGLVYDEQNLTLTTYVNGASAGSLGSYSRQTPWQNDTKELHYGLGAKDFTHMGTGYYGNFRFGAFQIYNRALSSSEVLSNFNATQDRFGPSISTPSDSSSAVNRYATFTATSCTSTSSATCTYQWQLSTDSGTTFADISGATSSTYTTPLISAANNGYKYRVKATDPGTGTSTATDLFAYSLPATLTVFTPPGSDTDTALTFDGSSQYASVADNSAFDITGAITMEAWVKPNSFPASGSSGMVFQKSGAYELMMANSGGTTNWYYGLWGSSEWQGVNTGVSVVLNEWHHIAITREAGSSTVNFYYDGVLAKSNGGSDTVGTGSIANSTHQFVIAARSTGGTISSSYFSGSIDHIALFNTARTSSDIQSDIKSYISPTTSGLIAYYDFNEESGTTLYNRVTGATSATDLAISGSPQWSDVKEVSSTNPYTVIKFPRSYITVAGGWKVPSGVVKASVIIVGGGGGAGAGDSAANNGGPSGGGGGGGVVYVPAQNLSPGAALTVTVGAGGMGGIGGSPADDATTRNGKPSIFGSTTALGGGGGGSYLLNARGAGSGSGDTSIATGGGSSGNGWSGYQCSGYSPAGGVVATGYNAARGAWGWGGAGGGARGAAIDGDCTTNSGLPGPGFIDPITSIEYGRGGYSNGYLANQANVLSLSNRGYGGSSAYNSPASNGNGYKGSDGVIIIRWITALVPTYTKPTNAYLNVGMTETFTTNVAVDSATVGLTRTFKWESTTPTANGIYTLIKQGTGAANASFSWVPADTSTSGSGYLYRLTVTDSDTAGLFITDSSTAYAVINRALVVSGNSTFGKTINVSRSETFTITLGTSTYRPVLTPAIPGITLDTSTAGLAIVKISETMTVGTYYETLTVTDSVSAQVVMPLTIKVVAPPTFSQSSGIAEPGLIYHLDPGNSASYSKSGTVISDLSGRNRTGTLGYSFGSSSQNYTYANGSLRTNTHQANVACSAPTFSNAPVGNLTYNTNICGYVPNIETVTTYTYDIWFKSTGTQDAWTPIVTSPYFNTSDQVVFSLNWLSGNTLAAGIYDGGSWWHTTTGTISHDVWTHATVTFNGSTLSLILNGDVAGKKTTSVTAFSWNPAKIVPAIQFAKKWDGALYFKGAIGSFRLYNRVLSTAEIEQNYLVSSNLYSGATNVPNKSAKYGSRFSDTYTAFAKGDSFNTTLTASVNGLKWDTRTALNASFLYQDTLTVGTYYDTITVTDNFGGSSYLPVTLTVAKADTLTIAMDTPTVVNFNKLPIVSYPKPVYRGLVGSDSLTVTTKFSSQIYALSSTVPTNADTYTVIASNPIFAFGAASNYQAIVYETSTAVVNKIAQRPLGIYMYGGVVGSPFLISLTGGDGDGAVSETLTGLSNIPGCAISNHYLTSTTSVQGFCEVQVVKAASQNYFSESQTVQLYFMAYLNNQPTGLVGSGATIAINGATSLTVDDTSTVRAPNVTSLSVSSGTVGTTIHIYGGNFGAGPLTIKFYRNKIATGTVTSGSDITVTVPSGATTGPILVITANGEASTPTFTVLP